MSQLSRRCCILSLVVTLVLVPGCFQHRTRVLTDPAGVQVSLAGSDLGQTPELSFQTPFWSFPGKSYQLTLSKQGHKQLKQTLVTRYHADLSLLWLACFIAPYFFTARIDKEYSYTLEPEVPEGLKPRAGAGQGPTIKD